MKEFWNERFSAEEYIYGLEPNQFLKSYLPKLEAGAKILFPAEGEGRNAVYAAMQGFNTHAFDVSDVGREKALKLARDNNVSIEYSLMDYHELELGQEEYDCIAMIYCHIHLDFRKEIFDKFISAIKSGGTLVLEGFNKEQIELTTGGPKSLDLLYSIDELMELTKSLETEHAVKIVTQIQEGQYHSGEARIVRLIARKK